MNIPSTNKEIRLSTLPPEAKHVIEAALASATIPLSNGRYCHLESKDDTFGAFLSEFLSEIDDPDGRNYVQVEIVPDELTGVRGWLANVWIGKSQGEDEWKWGISFFIREPDGLVDPTSYRCIGAG
jgi:hypothetical protein